MANKIIPKNLTVISVIQNDSGLCNLMIDSIKRFTDPNPKMIIIDKGGNKSIIKANRNNSNIRFVQDFTGARHPNTSMRHAYGINKALSLVDTEYTAVVESDCVVLRKDWFEFDSNKYHMLAALKSMEFGEEYYHMCFMVFKTKKLFGMNWMPIKELKPVKYWRDVGFRVYKHIGGTGEAVQHLNVRGCASGKTKIFKHGFEYKSFEMYKDDGMPIVAHFCRGSDLTRRPTNSIGTCSRQRDAWIKCYKDFVGGV